MADYSVIKAASYVLAHTPDMVIHNGTTQTTEMVVNPGSEYLTELPEHLRTYDDCLAYIPNCIGSYTHDLYEAEAMQVQEKFEDLKPLIAKRDTTFLCDFRRSCTFYP